MPILRAHSRYRCSGDEVLYVNAEVSLRLCGPTALPALACPVAHSSANSHTLAGSGVHYGSSYFDNFTTTDTEPAPEKGVYVTTAAYEVCVLNGGLIPGVGQSSYVNYNGKGKIDIIGEIPPAPSS